MSGSGPGVEEFGPGQLCERFVVERGWGSVEAGALLVGGEERDGEVGGGVGGTGFGFVWSTIGFGVGVVHGVGVVTLVGGRVAPHLGAGFCGHGFGFDG